MSEKDDPQKFLGSSHHQLKTDANELDADTREKLLQIQHRALESSLEKKSNFPTWISMPLMCFITALIFIALIYVKPNSGPQTDNSLEDLEVLMANDPIEFYENLEFLQKWKDPKNEKKDN